MHAASTVTNKAWWAVWWLGMLLSVSGAFAAEPPGAVLYRRHCARCHGLAADGKGGAASLFATPPRDLRHGVLDRHSVLELTRRIRQGTPLTLDREVGGLAARTGRGFVRHSSCGSTAANLATVRTASRRRPPPVAFPICRAT
jgi:mono/diheme cytochrome c family protein